MAGRAAASAGLERDQAFAAAHRELLADTSIQFQLQQYRRPEPPSWLGPLGDFLRAIWPALEVMFWIALAVLVLFLLYVIVSRLTGAEWRWRRNRAEEEEAPGLRPEQGQARQLLAEADALAAEGRYSEAIHLLLFRSIEDIDSRRPHLVRPALTSRDIAALDEIPPAPRSAFERLVMAVERSLFAGRSLGREEWSDCRSDYERFAFSESWRAQGSRI